MAIEMKQREPLQTETYFADAIAEKLKRVEQLNEYANNREKYSMDWEVIYMNRFYDYYILAQLYYSSGIKMSIIKDTITTCLTHGIDYFTSTEYIKNSKINSYKTDFNEYFNIVNTLSMAILLRVDVDLINKFFISLKIKGDDAFIDSLHHFINPSALISKKLIFEKLLQPAFDSLHKTGAEKLENLMAYLANWDKTVLRKRSVYNTHKPGYGTAFYGYWSFESAVIAYINNENIDKLKTYKFFPVDMLTYVQEK